MGWPHWSLMDRVDPQSKQRFTSQSIIPNSGDTTCNGRALAIFSNQMQKTRTLSKPSVA